MTPRLLLTVCCIVALSSLALEARAQGAKGDAADSKSTSDAARTTDLASESEVDDAAGGDVEETKVSDNEDVLSEDDAEEEDEEEDEDAPGPTFGLDYRIWGDAVSQPDFAGPPADRLALYQTLRIHVSDDLTDDLSLALELDLATGRLAGDPLASLPEGVNTGTRPRGRFYEWPNNITDVRALYAEYMTPVGQLQAGLQTSDWGLGILANSGSYEDEGLFNQHYGGDRVFRAVFATAPLQASSDSDFAKSLFLALGGDVVYRDENADFRQGDRAYQGVLAVLFDQEETQAGTYVVYRNQTDRDGDFLRVFAFDLFGQDEWSPGESDDWTLAAGAEAALLLGRTNRALGANTAEPLDVVGLGAASELSARWNPADVSLHLLAGYASGDANADDETLYRFRFDPNYQVGLVMFDHYLPQATLESNRRITDPSNSQIPPKGAEQLVNDGAVENAYYLNPQLRLGDDDEDGLLTGIGILWAIAEQPVADPYGSFEQGGNPTGLLGADPASRNLGWEADASLIYKYSPVDDLTLEVKGEYGIFFPGAAFADETGKTDSPQSLGRLRLGVHW